jgi:hypothetical protein
MNYIITLSKKILNKYSTDILSIKHKNLIESKKRLFLLLINIYLIVSILIL